MAWGALISAGASLLGGLFGKSKQETSNRIDYKQMVKDAEAAGFNPLTALRNGGSAGYMQTSHPALSSGAYIADAIGQFGSALASIDPMAEARAKLEDDLRKAQIANLNADTAARNRASIGGVPTSVGRSTSVTLNPALAVGGAPEAGDRTVTNPWLGGRVSPAVLDAEVFEARYGDSEIAQTLYGAHVAHKDYTDNYPDSLYARVARAAMDPNYTLPGPRDFADFAKNTWHDYANRQYNRHVRSVTPMLHSRSQGGGGW